MAGICYRFDKRRCHDYDKSKLKDAKARMRRFQKIPLHRRAKVYLALTLGTTKIAGNGAWQTLHPRDMIGWAAAVEEGIVGKRT
eukprot:10030516-Karenia_brevis.AAC.1